jgi:hypothetical protein
MDQNTMNVINRQNAAHGAALNKQLVDALTPLVQAMQILEYRVRVLETPLHQRFWAGVKIVGALVKLRLTRRQDADKVKEQ